MRINSPFLYDLTDQDQQDLENLFLFSLEVNSPSFWGAEVTRETCVSTRKTQRKQEGILLAPALRAEGHPSAPLNSCSQLNGEETRPPPATEELPPCAAEATTAAPPVPPRRPPPASSGACQPTPLQANASPARTASAGCEACAPYC